MKCAHRKTAVDILVEGETSRSTADEVLSVLPEDVRVVGKSGAGERTRTADLLITSGNEDKAKVIENAVVSFLAMVWGGSRSSIICRFVSLSPTTPDPY